MSVHRSDCVNILTGIDDSSRLIEVSWHTNGSAVTYPTEIIVIAHDRSDLLLEVINILSEAKLTCKAVNARVNKEGNAVINITIEIQDIEQLDRIIEKINKIKDVIEVSRIRH